MVLTCSKYKKLKIRNIYFVVAKKISNTRQSQLINPPTQDSYEKVDRVK